MRRERGGGGNCVLEIGSDLLLVGKEVSESESDDASQYDTLRASIPSSLWRGDGKEQKGKLQSILKRWHRTAPFQLLRHPSSVVETQFLRLGLRPNILELMCPWRETDNPLVNNFFAPPTERFIKLYEQFD